MRILLVEPGKAPRPTEIGDGLESMQVVVGGSIQAVYPFEEPVALVCNDEGKLLGLPLNRVLRLDTGEIYDVIARHLLPMRRPAGQRPLCQPDGGTDRPLFGTVSGH